MDISTSVSEILEQARMCKTQGDVNSLLDELRGAFTGCPTLFKLKAANGEASLKNGEPHIRFELNKVISPHCLTIIRPELRRGKFSLAVATYLVSDGSGEMSKSREAAHGIAEEFIEAGVGHDLLDLGARAKELATAHHRTLLVNVGVPPFSANSLAEQSW